MRRQELHSRTAVINKSQKNQSKKARNEALLWLATTFPKVFDSSRSIQPLKLGIMKDILLHAEKAQELGISRSKLREAVVVFTRSIEYLTCLKLREMRVDLECNPIEPVTEEEAEKAALKIKKRVEKSARNARKTISVKAPNSFSNNDTNPYYVERPPMFSAQNAATIPAKSPVIVKHKSVRAYDPEAVARLKEKLGLSRKNELMNETAE